MEERNAGSIEDKVDPNVVVPADGNTHGEEPLGAGNDGISWFTVKNMYRDLKRSITDEHNRTRLQIAEQGCQIGLILERKLDFNIESVDPAKFGEVAQDGFGSPFTYGNGNKAHAGVEMPWCFSMVWRPPKEMVFCGAELAVAAYIFNAELPNLEILVDTEHRNLTREMLFCLVPGEILKDYVIDLVVENLADEKDELRWFLPTEFSANFLQLIFDDRSFFESTHTKKPIVSKFKFKEAETPQQLESNDGGIWVAKWMQHSYMWDGYLDKVDEKTRMSLALELVMGNHNRKADAVRDMATSTWDKIVCRAILAERRKRKKSGEMESQPSNSTSI
ncbi:hypothetical protein PIB30_049022 [Stylosanthes scabra]|uniref:Uncharacterized protein n=1 Tax=Stylosanthes scabra TaxID=79078 RepID=A0ABU6RHY0_9FABA|nr:hypothetical protein [Stylosanthes scabra]